MKKLVKTGARHLKLTGILKRAFVESQMLGERLKFSLQGRPDPSQNILLVGSGRSGTTWIRDLVAASPGVQQVFEPLNPDFDHRIPQLTGWEKTTGSYIRSFYLRPNSTYPDWHNFLEQLLSGHVRSYWTDLERTSYFPDRFLIKLIRANLMLGYIYNNFHPQIVYVTRHPCAVVYSRLREGWFADVADILSQELLVEDYLRPWVRHIETERDLLGAHAAWWAVENMVATQELSLCPHYSVTYETLCLLPQREISRLCSLLQLGSRQISRKIIERPSRVSNSADFSASVEGRLTTWQKHLTFHEQCRILDWTNRLGVSLYNERILPVNMQSQLQLMKSFSSEPDSPGQIN